MKILRAIRKRGQRNETPLTITHKILKQHTTRFQPHESSTLIPPSPPPVNEKTLTIRLVFPGRELPNQDFVTPIMATICQLTQRITALFVSPSLITNTLLYVRSSGPTWTKFHRPGPISNKFLPGEFMIPCAYLEQGTILRVVPYFIPCQEEQSSKNDDSDEGEFELGEEDEEYKEDPWYYTNTKATPRRKQRRTSTAILILLPLPPIPAFRFIKNPIFAPNTVNLVPNQLQDKKKLIQEFDNEPRNESEIGETNDNKTYKNLPLRILIHMDSTRTPSNH
jgi:hypothetical protein